MENKKIKLAIVCGSMKIGGGETMAAKLAGYIDREEFEVKLFIIGEYIENQIAAVLKETKVDFVCLNLPSSFSLKTYKVFSKALTEFAPDVVHEHLDASYAWVWSILKNKPLISTLHSDPYRRKDKRVETVIRVKSIQGHFRMIGCSKMTSTLAKSCYRLQDKFVGHIHNPIEVSKFKSDSNLKTKAYAFVAMGRLHEVKNYPLMIEAFKRTLDSGARAELYIAGSGPRENELKQMVRKLSIEEDVHFLGNVANIPELLSQTDVLLLSSVSEACPMVILEAMAAGLPIIATSVGGVPELVSDNGILIENGDVEAFANAMQTLINDAEMVKIMSERSLAYCVKYDKANIARQYEEEYLSLASKRRSKWQGAH